MRLKYFAWVRERIGKAEETVLLALEAAPDYRPAQKLLLQLQDSEKGK